jgi:hypothetical protein
LLSSWTWLDDLLDGMPLGVQLQRARREARHLKRVLHRPVQPVGLLVQGFQQIAGSRVEARLVLGGARDPSAMWGLWEAELSHERQTLAIAASILGLGMR